MANRGCSLLVRNLRFETTPEKVREIFERIGRVKDVYLPIDHTTKEPRGFGFVEYFEEKDAQNAVREFDRFLLDGNELSVIIAQDRRKSVRGTIGVALQWAVGAQGVMGMAEAAMRAGLGATIGTMGTTKAAIRGTGSRMAGGAAMATTTATEGMMIIGETIEAGRKTIGTLVEDAAEADRGRMMAIAETAIATRQVKDAFVPMMMVSACLSWDSGRRGRYHDRDRDDDYEGRARSGSR
ncbi:RNA binding motif-containing protein, putative [Eimeria praecox]|uniref:RNA binding motif-containing protein, putative n=1 Tax=Eimeria praecox TaxID=51316 RepID=U6G2D7_9EIME|nr:RNA binding motif-containing protein, putative [Eimeria praecox]